MIKKTAKHIKVTYWSMKNAVKGIRTAFKSERNFKTEIVVITLTFVAAYILDFSYIEFSIISISAFCVLGAELFNTAIEESWNKLHPDHHETVGKIKDLASGGVFLVGLGAALSGAFILINHIFV